MQAYNTCCSIIMHIRACNRYVVILIIIIRVKNWVRTMISIILVEHHHIKWTQLYTGLTLSNTRHLKALLHLLYIYIFCGLTKNQQTFNMCSILFRVFHRNKKKEVLVELLVVCVYHHYDWFARYQLKYVLCIINLKMYHKQKKKKSQNIQIICSSIHEI